VPKDKLQRLAGPPPVDRRAEAEQDDRRVGGAEGRFGRRRWRPTAADYLRFSQMLLNGGQPDGAHRQPPDVALMASDHLGTRIAAPFTPGELLLGTPGYTFAWFAVRQGAGVAGVPGRPTSSCGPGTAAPISGSIRRSRSPRLHEPGAEPDAGLLSKLFKQLVYAAIVD
jgi:hypothetical protein